VKVVFPASMCATIPMFRSFAAEDTSEVPPEKVEGRRPGIARSAESADSTSAISAGPSPGGRRRNPGSPPPQHVERPGRGERLRGQDDRSVLVRRHAEPLGARALDLPAPHPARREEPGDHERHRAVHDGDPQAIEESSHIPQRRDGRLHGRIIRVAPIRERAARVAILKA